MQLAVCYVLQLQLALAVAFVDWTAARRRGMLTLRTLCRDGSTRVLITTDVWARGLDVQQVCCLLLPRIRVWPCLTRHHREPAKMPFPRRVQPWSNPPGLLPMHEQCAQSF